VRTFRIARTEDLSSELLAKIKSMLEDAFAEPFVEDWDHALGGMHFIVEDEDEPLSHASVVERALETGGRRLRTGYVEAVATRPDMQGEGLGAQVMAAATEHIRRDYELGALGTGSFDFYARLGWEVWRGPLFVRTESGPMRTPDEDGFVMVLRTPSTPRGLDLSAELSCDWRTGDVW
jgi:aminoglycoside 2'-N-acetyltransferase I